MLQENFLEEDAMPNIINQLIELDESWRNDLERSIKNQEKVKKTFDKSANQGLSDWRYSFIMGQMKGETRKTWEVR